MERRRERRLALAAALAAAAIAGFGTGAPSARGDGAHDWNDGAIRWHGFLAGMERIEKEGLPGLLVFHSKRCPHCARYSAQFHDPAVVRLARRFVMIRIDREDEPALNELYGEQGTYVPRTLFLGRDGRVDWRVRGANRGHPFFLDADQPDELVTLMQGFVERDRPGRPASRTTRPSPVASPTAR